MTRSVLSGLTFLLLLAGTLQSQTLPNPIISSISPTQTTAGAAQFTLIITGSGFTADGVSRATWNGVILPFPSSLTPTRMTVTVDSSLLTAAGTAQVRVVNFGQLFSNTKDFVVNPAPVITPGSLPNGTVGVLYSQQLTVAGGTSPMSAWSVTALPSWLTLSSAGLLTGTPPATGTHVFTVSITDSAGVSARTQYTLIVTAPPLVIRTTSLGGMTVGVAYSLNLTATGGTPPYNWRVVEGALPSGLTVNGSLGVIDGTPVAAGTGFAQISVSDSRGQNASRVFNWTVNPAPLAITTASPLQAGTVAAAYSQTLAATGGISPYTWSISSGALPPGLSLGQSETQSVTLSGTPTQGGVYNFTVGVTDTSKASATKAFTLTVSVPQAPTLSVTGLTDIVNPAQQPTLDVQLSSAYVLALTGKITLTFAPDAVAPSDDPSIQFSSGGRTLSFTIPAGQTRAFPTSPPAIQTGTVAGRIDLTLQSLQAGGQDITPTTALLRSVQIARSAPTITSVQVVNKTSSGFTVRVTGYSTPRQVTQAVFTFAPSSGGNLGTTQLTVPVDAAFTTWFMGTASGQFGSSFLYTQPFQVQGALTDIASVSVTLTSSAGTSQPASASF